MRRASTRVSDSPSSSVCDQTIKTTAGIKRRIDAADVEGASKRHRSATGHVEASVSVDPRNFSRILLATTPARRNRPVNQGNCNFDAESVPVSRLHACPDSHAAARRAATPGSAPAPATPTLLANEPGLDPRLSFPIVIGNIIGPVASISINLAGIILLAAAISRLDGVTFPELV